ncbi:MAG: YceI family protein [Bacteroidota bacterium]|nr:YceI family protein [Bacteroidota bacterium]
MNKKIGRVLILLLIGCVIGFGILYQTWGGNPESKLNKTTLLENTMITNSSFDSILGTTWINQKNDTSSSEVSFTIESSPKYTKGIFENFDIIFKVSEDDPSKSKLRVTIDVSSINTDNEMRDENLMDEDYFSFNDFPKISFQSNEILKTDSSYWASGLIDMMGFQNELSFHFIFKGLGQNNRQQKVAIFEGGFTLDRVKLGMPAIKSIGNQVDVKFYCELIEKN